MNRLIVIISAMAICACGGARSSPSADGSATKDGVYEFSASIPGYQPGTTVRAQGTLTAVEDSLWVDAGAGCVQPVAGVRSPSSERVAIVYCGGARLTFDRKNPASARWYATVQVAKQRKVCSEWERGEATRGVQRRCLILKTETYYSNEQRNGAVQVKRIN